MIGACSIGPSVFPFHVAHVPSGRGQSVPGAPAREEVADMTATTTIGPTLREAIKREEVKDDG